MLKKEKKKKKEQVDKYNQVTRKKNLELSLFFIFKICPKYIRKSWFSQK